MNKYVLLVLMLINSTAYSFAGEWQLITTPHWVEDSNNVYYIPVSKTVASTPGVMFQISTQETNGYVTDLEWSFVDGTPATSLSTTATVMYNSSAYGAKAAFSFTFDHYKSGSGMNNLCSSPNITNYVNVVKPQLIFNRSPSVGWSSSNSKAASWAANLQFATQPPTINTPASFMNGGPTPYACHGTPYEYRLTALPSSCGALNTDFSIEEIAHFVWVGYTSTSSVNLMSTTYAPAYYTPSRFDTTAAGSTVVPADPQLYGCDSPGDSDAESAQLLNNNGSPYVKVVETITLTSTPLYQSSTNPPDTQLSTSSNFTLVVRTNGSGGYNWTNN